MGGDVADVVAALRLAPPQHKTPLCDWTQQGKKIGQMRKLSRTQRVLHRPPPPSVVEAAVGNEWSVGFGP
eukprot:5804154-Pyramimonas_sp.AAC.1